MQKLIIPLYVEVENNVHNASYSEIVVFLCKKGMIIIK
jgi:hypothetical protein